ncbi:hypothetical protein GCM10027596_31680 [Nocardioides korecus]
MWFGCSVGDEASFPDTSGVRVEVRAVPVSGDGCGSRRGEAEVMVQVATAAVTRRRRARSRRVARLGAQGRPAGVSVERAAQVRLLGREGRRALRAREVARRRTQTAQTQAGTRLVAMVGVGMPLVQAADVLRISRSEARRLTGLARDVVALSAACETRAGARAAPARCPVVQFHSVAPASRRSAAMSERLQRG